MQMTGFDRVSDTNGIGALRNEATARGLPGRRLPVGDCRCFRNGRFVIETPSLSG
jgi:hypothetical protein